MKHAVFLIIVLFFFYACTQNKETDKNVVVLYCASSLTDVVSEIAAGFEKSNQVVVKLNLASSGTLARQIEHGATPAIFISANKNWVDYLNKLGLTVPEAEKSIAKNSMVLIAPLESKLDSFAFSPEINLPELFRGRLSIGDPQHVPAGNYTIQLLEKLGCKNEMESRFLPAKDVRSALMVVELGEVEAGIVYKTDALKSGKVKIITEFPDSLYEPVCYFMTMVQGQQNELSDKLYNYIMSDETKNVWKKYGFKL